MRDATTLLQSRDLALVTAAPRPHERFAPGAVVAGRYRIVALLGRGGMGEVYRADDVRLDQTVALKFLPPRLESNADALARLQGEVRLGRQVAHPNVCRLYDIGEHDGHPFLTMEYVDGEDLESLLARIGKLPVEKVTQIARDIAAGLAAAHALGIVHRDLKPSNVMIDGRGRARITDFGLAALDRDLASDARIVGTPAYMAPEQIAGEAATPRSDVYSFGLILYECLTGEALYDGGSAEEVIRKRMSESGANASVSSVRSDDVVIDRLLRRCLDPDPEQRPATGSVVLGSLPGGDPLAAAMAAGETPSPELVAAAGEHGELSHAAAWSLLALTILGTIVAVVLAGRTMLYRNVDNVRSPDTLHERATEIAAAVAPGPAGDRSSWFHWDYAHLNWLRERVTGNAEWRPIVNQRPTPLRFTYRQSPEPMVAGLWEGRIDQDDPPLNAPGMSRVTLDPRGRLLELAVVPPAVAANAQPANWQQLFAWAELPAASFKPDTPQWTAPVASDERRAWTGTMPGSNLPLRVEAASRAGRPVWFAVIAPFRQSKPLGRGTDAGLIAMTMLQAGVPLLTAFLAWRNVRRGRGDRRGALKMALFIFVSMLVARSVRAHHVPDLGQEVLLVQRILGEALLAGIIGALAYLGLEPFVRRYQPAALISWVRLVNGRLRDPLVGRHVLTGLTVGALAAVLWSLFAIAQPLFGLRSAMPLWHPATTLGGIGHALFYIVSNFGYSAMDGINIAFLLVIIRSVVRNRYASTALLYLVGVLILLRVPGDLPIVQLAFAVITAAAVLAIFRVAGVLGVTAMAFSANLLTIMPLTLDPGSYYAGRSALALLVPLAFAAAAFVVSLGSKPVFGEA